MSMAIFLDLPAKAGGTEDSYFPCRITSLGIGMETPNRKLLETIARTVFPERFKVDPQGTRVLAFKWWREYVQ